MEVHSVGHAEPRWESRASTYRVHFWEQPVPDYAYNLDAYLLVGAADVAEAVRWAHDNAHGRPLELFVEIDSEPADGELQVRDVPLVRLMGANPTEH